MSDKSGLFDQDYLYQFLSSDDTYRQFDNFASGSTVRNLNIEAAKKVKVLLPSILEQRRIVAILDEAFEGIDTAVANTKKNLANARELFNSYMQSIFINRGESLLVPIGNLGRVFDGPHATPKTMDAGPIFLGISTLQDGQIILESTRHVSPIDFQQWTRRVKPQPRDVVFSYETRLGQAALIPENLECCLGRRMGLLRTNPALLDPEFFVYQYISPPFRKFLHTRIVRGATVDRIALKEFPSFPIYLPKLSEQKNIVSKLTSLRTEVDRLISTAQHKVKVLAELKQAILHKAFAGELTANPEKALPEAAE